MKKWFRNMLKGMSFTSMLFVFQACYGTPSGYFFSDVDVNVTAKESGLPISNLKVSLQPLNTNDFSYEPIVGYTNNEGRVLLSLPTQEQVQLTIEDIDNNANGGSFQKKDTLIMSIQYPTTQLLTLNFQLEKAE